MRPYITTSPYLAHTLADPQQSFAKQDLPADHRVVKPDSMSTADFKKDRYVLQPHLGMHGLSSKPEGKGDLRCTTRLNVHVDDDGTVKHVDMG